ncbi:MAG TPA: SLC13/DASS family transporter [Crenotrichaceae bacterium]|nr:SLC13/DASS family transporter [Crenotrichaceae bacterium]
MTATQQTGLFLAICLPAYILFTGDFGDNPKTPAMAAIALMMALLWVTEAIPLSATALLPLILFPVLGISSTKIVATTYMNSTVFLLIGGFLIALAMQRWNLHRRIALAVLSAFGAHPMQLMAGFILATAGLSMWISNTATTLVMLPIALAILSRFDAVIGKHATEKLTTGFLLAIAYSASIGGMMTPVGTAPNLVFLRLYEVSHHEGSGLGFTEWMLFTTPISVVLLACLMIYLSFRYCRGVKAESSINDFIAEEKSNLGVISFEEKVVSVVFAIAALLWITRKKIQTDVFTFPGWQSLVPNGSMMDDSTVAIAMALILFVIPARTGDGCSTRVLDQSVFQKLPWSVVLLFGGGFALASGFVDSGLSSYLAQQVGGFTEVTLATQLFLVTGLMTALTELTSNTATTQLVLPILQSIAVSMEVKPEWLMIPATLAASCAFMFPVATPPNAIVFSSGQLKMSEMLSAGLILNVIAIITISVLTKWLLPLVLGV